MLTDEQAEEARLAYEAHPAAPPDAWISRKRSDDPDENRRLFQEMGREAKAAGMDWLRFTDDEPLGWLWCEMWKYRPYKAALFSPQYTHEPAPTRGSAL